jgi:hypothetical protein
MLSVEHRTAERVAAVMKEVYGGLGIDFKIYVTKIDEKGVRINDVLQHQ